jgi:hypothetical protein
MTKINIASVLVLDRQHMLNSMSIVLLFHEPIHTGSHLVEKCLTSATQDQANSIVLQLITPTDHNAAHRKNDDHGEMDTGQGGRSSVLMALMKDPYANFVVQKAFDVSGMELKRDLATEIHRQAEVLQSFTYGRHILAHIARSGLVD